LFVRHSSRNFAERPCVGNRGGRLSEKQAQPGSHDPKKQGQLNCCPERQDESPSEKQGELHVVRGRSLNDSPIIVRVGRVRVASFVRTSKPLELATRPWSERQSPQAIKNDKHTNSIKPIADWTMALISVSGVAAWPIFAQTSKLRGLATRPRSERQSLNQSRKTRLRTPKNAIDNWTGCSAWPRGRFRADIKTTGAGFAATVGT